jgi:hypothetical protein
MAYILIALAFWILGLLSFPLIAFIRARRSSSWDDSNMMNMIRLLSHVIAHPGDFGKMSYDNGKKPFWYINKDEFSDIVKTRPIKSK